MDTVNTSTMDTSNTSTMVTISNEIIYTLHPAGVDNLPREVRRTWHDEDFNSLYHARLCVIGKNQFRESFFMWGIESINPKEGVSYASLIVNYLVSQLRAKVRSRFNKPAKSLDDMLDLLKKVLEPENFVSDMSIRRWLLARLPITDAFGKGAFKINGVIYSNEEVTVAGWLALIVSTMFKEAELALKRDMKETSRIQKTETQKI